MTNTHETQQPAAVFRGMLAILVIAYMSTLYLEWHPPKLSVEATQYHQLVELTMTGFSVNFVLQKLCWLVGNSLGALGVALMFFRSRRGLPLLFLCPLLLGAAALLGTASPAYPDIESTTTMLLWCMSSAIWGCVITCALLRGEALFPRLQKTNQPAKGSTEDIQRSV
jgi:hypothetical protein